MMVTQITRQQVSETASYIRSHSRYQPIVGLVLGSGLGPLAERIEEPDIIPFEEIPHFPKSTVPGHSGRLLLGRLGSVDIMLMQGRVHYYEGYSAAEITLPIRAMQLLGIQAVIVTNAAGGIRKGFRPGDLMAITDHINLVGMAGHTPLRGPNDAGFGPRFPSMSRAYDPGLLERLCQEARAQGIQLHEGIYLMAAGPNFETPAEVRMLRAWGADAVGMSTVPEVLVARHGGMRVLGISMISNVAIDSFVDDPDLHPTHDEVLAAGKRAVPALTRLIEGVLSRWD